ncbi:hypothetical protein OF83DRAFT_1172492 [Amylostereum chailletii]|nr:hypothetical protein OF83DRAFT_1172492 [Amylostereum chailletii]
MPVVRRSLAGLAAVRLSTTSNTPAPHLQLLGDLSDGHRAVRQGASENSIALGPLEDGGDSDVDLGEHGTDLDPAPAPDALPTPPPSQHPQHPPPAADARSRSVYPLSSLPDDDLQSLDSTTRSRRRAPYAVSFLPSPFSSSSSSSPSSSHA